MYSTSSISRMHVQLKKKNADFQRNSVEHMTHLHLEEYRVDTGIHPLICQCFIVRTNPRAILKNGILNLHTPLSLIDSRIFENRVKM